MAVGVGQIRSSTRGIWDLILAVLQTDPAIGMTPEEIATKMDAIRNNYGEDSKGRPPTVNLHRHKFNRSTLRSHLHRMHKAGEVTNSNGRWQAVANFTVQKKASESW